jgi:hypothetical protein
VLSHSRDVAMEILAGTQLRFSKTGDPNLEAAYATHLIRLGQ